jgi:TrpR family trp operon transcriptional repressor
MAENEELAKVFSRITDLDEMNMFFSEIFTEAERRDFNLRWKLMQMLKAGVSQRKIASELGISLCKITRGAKVLKNSESVSSRMLSEE